MDISYRVRRGDRVSKPASAVICICASFEGGLTAICSLLEEVVCQRVELRFLLELVRPRFALPFTVRFQRYDGNRCVHGYDGVYSRCRCESTGMVSFRSDRRDMVREQSKVKVSLPRAARRHDHSIDLVFCSDDATWFHHIDDAGKIDRTVLAGCLNWNKSSRVGTNVVR